MRASEFWSLMDGEFGVGYAATLAREHVLSALGERTPEQALAAGLDPREVWLALCVDLQVPVERRLGPDDPKGTARSGRRPR